MRARILSTAVLVHMALTAPILAGWLETFNGGFEQSWTFEAIDDIGNPPTTGTSSAQIVDAGDDYLLLRHSTAAIAGGGGGAAYRFGYVDELIPEVVVGAAINVAPAEGQQSQLGVLARGNPNNGQAYVAGVNFDNGTFGLARNDGFTNPLIPLANDNTVSIDSNDRYFVKLKAVGSNITAWLYTERQDKLISQLNAVDDTYLTGVAGVVVETAYDADNPIGPVVGTFDNVVAVGILAGDANNDEQVTGSDLISVQRNFGSTRSASGTWPGDANDDGRVTGADLISVQQNFGNTLSTFQSPALPEPSTVLLLGAAWVRSRFLSSRL